MHAHTHVFSRVKELIYGSWCWDLKTGLTDNSFDRFYHILWFLKWFRLFQVMKCGHRWPQPLCLISILVYKKFDYLFPLWFPLFSNNRSKLLYMFMIEVKKKACLLSMDKKISLSCIKGHQSKILIRIFLNHVKGKLKILIFVI